MALERMQMVMSSPVWTSCGLAMMDFLVLGAAAWLLLSVVRAVSRPLPPGARYALACFSLLFLMTLAGGAVAWRWPAFKVAVVAGANPQDSVAEEQPVEWEPAEPIAQAARVASATIAPVISVTRQRKLAAWLPWIWLAGSPWVAAYVACGWFGASRLKHGAIALEESALQSLFERCARTLNVRGAVIAVGQRIASPMVVGVVRPIILIPASLVSSLTPEQWEMILLHELAHIRRHDNLVNLLQRLVEAVLFFHPAVWWASRWVRLEREHCCDAVVLARGTTAQAYAETLAVVALPGLAPQLATAAMANHQILTRMRHILGTEDLEMPISRKRFAALTAIAACVVAAMTFGPAAESRGQTPAAEIARQNERIRAAEAQAALLQAEMEQLVQTAQQTAARQLEEQAAKAATAAAQSAWQEAALKDKQMFFEMKADRDNEQITEAKAKLEQELKQLEERKAAIERKRAYAGKVYGQFLKGSDDATTKNKRPWGPEQVIGPPDVEEGGDNPRAWAARNADEKAELLSVSFGQPVKASAIAIRESFNPGAIKSIRVSTEPIEGDEIHGWGQRLSNWGVKPSTEARMLIVPLDLTSREIIGVQIEIQEPEIAGWNEIDAVGLIDADTAEIHWATSASATSTYADIVQPQTGRKTLAGSPGKKVAGWSAMQATGAPDVPDAGDDKRAWASATPDGQPEWLELTYDPPVEAAAILVYESCNPGALLKASVPGSLNLALDVQIGEPGQPKAAKAGSVSVGQPDVIWQSGNDPAASQGSKGVAVLPLKPMNQPIHTLRLEFDSPSIAGWNEVDAVGIVDATTGKVHWATDATASSSFADREPSKKTIYREVPDKSIKGHATAGFSPNQAAGAPNVSTSGDNPSAWASSSPDSGSEWLELKYDPPVKASTLFIFESFNPGALTCVSIEEGPPMTQGQIVEAEEIVIWKGKDPVQIQDGKGVTTIPIPAGTGDIATVRLHFDTTAVAGWNEIDAVGLLDAQAGTIRWASTATASSWFGGEVSVDLEFSLTPPAPSLEKLKRLNEIDGARLNIRSLDDSQQEKLKLERLQLDSRLQELKSSVLQREALMEERKRAMEGDVKALHKQLDELKQTRDVEVEPHELKIELQELDAVDAALKFLKGGEAEDTELDHEVPAK
jgi:beta-lactamase regulating signal transducer with metallopeptidase domain